MNEDLTYEIEVDTEGLIVEMEFDEDGVHELDLTYMDVDNPNLEGTVDSELDEDFPEHNINSDTDETEGFGGDEDDAIGLDEEIDY